MLERGRAQKKQSHKKAVIQKGNAQEIEWDSTRGHGVGTERWSEKVSMRV